MSAGSRGSAPRVVGLRQRLHELAPEHPRQRVHREQEVARALGFDPVRVAVGIAAQRPAGHQRMHVQVASQVLRPGVQHQREGADAAQPARVGGELGERGGRALHQRVVDPARVHRGQRVELVRQREHQVAVRHVEQLGQPRRAPGIARTGLALRAMPIAARVPAPRLGTAAVAAQALAAQCRRAAARRWRARRVPARVLRRVRAQISRPEVPQHLGQRGGHGRLSASRDGRQRRQQRQRLAPGAVGQVRPRQVQVARGGADVAVAEPLLQAVQVHAGFEQVGGIAVAQGVDAAVLGDARGVAGARYQRWAAVTCSGRAGIVRGAEQPLARLAGATSARSSASRSSASGT